MLLPSEDRTHATSVGAGADREDNPRSQHHYRPLSTSRHFSPCEGKIPRRGLSAGGRQIQPSVRHGIGPFGGTRRGFLGKRKSSKRKTSPSSGESTKSFSHVVGPGFYVGWLFLSGRACCWLVAAAYCRR